MFISTNVYIQTFIINLPSFQTILYCGLNYRGTQKQTSRQSWISLSSLCQSLLFPTQSSVGLSCLIRSQCLPSTLFQMNDPVRNRSEYSGPPPPPTPTLHWLGALESKKPVEHLNVQLFESYLTKAPLKSRSHKSQTPKRVQFAIGTVILLVRVYCNNKLVLVYRQFLF